MINIPVQLDTEKLIKKPETKRETMDIRKRCLLIDNYKEVTRDGLIEVLASSRSFIPCKTDNQGNSESDFIETGLIILDVDNTYKDENGNIVGLNKEDPGYLSIEKALTVQLVRNYAFAIQKSIRYSDELEKFKIVFVLKEAITDYKKMQSVYLYLKEQIPYCDDAVSSSTRLFYGGYREGAVIEINKDNTLDITKLPINYEVAKKTGSSNDLLSRSSGVANESDFSAMILRGNKLEMQQWFEGCLFNPDGMSFNEIYENLLKLDMASLLKTDSSLKCIFHDDDNPSANIFLSKDGHSIFKCHSSNCGVCTDFIGVVRLILRKNSRVETFNWLLEKLELYPSHFQKLRRKYIRLFDTLDSKGDELFKTINDKLEEMRYIYEVLLSNVHFLDDRKGGVICILSGALLAKKMEFYYGKTGTYATDKWNKLLSFMTFLGIITKLDDDEIPEQMLDYLNEQKKEKQFGERVGNFDYKRSNVYQLEISDYETVFDKLTGEIIPNLERFYFTYEYFSYAWVELCFNEDVAKSVFPQNSRLQLSPEKQLIIKEAMEVLNELSLQHNYIITESLLINKVLKRLPDFKYNSVKNTLKENRGYFVKEGFYLFKATKNAKKVYNLEANHSCLVYGLALPKVDETIAELIQNGCNLIPLHEVRIVQVNGQRMSARKAPIKLN